MSVKNSNETIGNRIHDLPACSATNCATACSNFMSVGVCFNRSMWSFEDRAMGSGPLILHLIQVCSNDWFTELVMLLIRKRKMCSKPLTRL
jgi:hypothetical protein